MGDSATIAITLRIPPDPEERQQAIDACVDNWHEEAIGARGQDVTCRAVAPGFRLERRRGGDDVAVRITPI